MPLPTVGGHQAFKPATETATGGAHSRKYKDRKKAQHGQGGAYQPNEEALESLAELKRERGIDNGTPQPD